MSQIDDFESGKAAPATLTRNYNSVYIHQTPKGPITYVQSRYPRGNFWELAKNGGGSFPPGVEVLNDLADVNASNNSGEALAYDSVTGVWSSLEMSPRGNTLIVSTRGYSTFFGAAREKSTFHFNSLAEAQSAAQAGDMIIVYPGTYTNPNNLWIPDVNYYFFPGATVSRTFGQMLNSAAGGECNIYGKGDFISTATISDNWDFQNGCVCKLEANNIVVRTNTGLIFRDTADVIIDCNEIRMTFRQYLIYWRIFSGRSHIKANKIVMENGAGIGTARIFTQREIAAEADIKVECPFMETLSNQSFVSGIFGIELTSPGVPRYYGDFYDNRTGDLTDATIYQRTSHYHEGNIYVNPNVRAMNIDFSIPKVITMKGNIYALNNTTRQAITTGSANGELNFEGNIYCSNVTAVTLGGNNWKTVFKGNIFNTALSGSVVKGIEVNSATHDLIIEYFKAYFENAPHVAGSYSITGSNHNIRVYADRVLSNVDIDPATIDLLTGAVPADYPNVI